MTDRERHLKVLEEFYRHHYQYDCGDYSGIGDDVAKAIQYAISSIKTDLKYDLLYEGEESTTKNDLGVDCIARQDVERFIEGFINEYTPKEELEFINLELDGLKHLPSVTPQEPTQSSIIDWNKCHTSEQLDSIATTKNNLAHNLCDSCTNIGCEFQSGIVRTKCAFYMPPHIQPDNCGNYVVQNTTTKNDLGVDLVSRADVDAVIEQMRVKLKDGRMYILAEVVQDIIRELPSVTPIRPKGHWIEDDEQRHVEKTYHCSECGHGAWGEYEKTEYCGGCGAKMV